MNSKVFAGRRKNFFSYTTCLVGAATMAFALAPMGASAQDDEEEIIVTGSRIARPNLDSPTATLAVDEEFIQNSGAVDVAEVLRELPATGFSTFTPENTGGLSTAGFGLSSVELRNLTENRTLVLVDGRRFVSGFAGANIVDFNSIPTEMIERVDVVTGGASSVYGSDALAGVVNIILRDNVDGLIANARAGITEEGDDENFRVDLVGGTDFADGRGHATIGFGWNRSGGAFARDRELLGTDSIVPGAFGIPQTDEKEVFEPFFSSYSEHGRFVSGGPSGNAFAPDGSAFSTGALGFNRQAFRALIAPIERFTGTALLEYRVNPNLNWFGQMNYSSTEADTGGEPFPMDSNQTYGDGTANFDAQCAVDGFNVVQCINGIPLNSAIVPVALRNAILADIAAEFPGATVDANNLVLGMRRRLTEVGARNGNTTRQTYRFTTGFEGDLAGDWRYEVSYVHGRTDETQFADGQAITANLREALDAVPDGSGGIMCRSALARAQGCVPANVFGIGNISAAAAAYIGVSASRTFSIEQNVLSGYATGSWFELPAGAVEVSVGAEYREESSSDIPDALTQTGGNASNKTAPTIGSFDVWETFGELRVPLMDTLTWNIAARYSDYSTVGDTLAYSTSLEFRPTEDLFLRGQYARAVRAPNLGELFGGVVQDFPTVNDPCNGVGLSGGQPAFFDSTLGSGPAAFAAGPLPGTIGDPVATACMAVPQIQARVAAQQAMVLGQQEIQGVSGFDRGNPNLSEETSDSYTFGVVYNPSGAPWLEPLSISVDYFKISVEDAVGVLSEQFIIDSCYEGPALNPTYCQYVVRVGAGPFVGGPQRVDQLTLNLGSVETSGIDVQASYGFNLGSWGDLDISATYQHLLQYDVVPIPGAAASDNLGEIGLAEDRLLLTLGHTLGRFSTNWTTRVIGDSTIDNEPGNIFEGAEIGARVFHDMQVRFNMTDDASVYFGVDNVFNEYVVIGDTNGSIGATGHRTVPEVYDGLGRSYYVGLRSTF